MFTETKSRLGWRTGTSRSAMKEQLQALQSFDPAERARAGQALVGLGLTRCADPLLDHVANEFDNRVLAAVAAAVIQTLPEPKESRRVQELREWAAAELERSALEDAFMGGEAEPAVFPPEPDFQSAGLEDREPLPMRVPVAAVTQPGAVEYDLPEPAAEPEPVAYRFEVPEPAAVEYAVPEPAAVEYDVPEPAAVEYAAPEPEPIAYRFEVPEPAPEPEPVAYRFDAPAAAVARYPEPPEPSYAPVPHYISWSPPADDEISNGSAGNGNGQSRVSGAEPPFEAPTIETESIDTDGIETDHIEGEIAEIEGIETDHIEAAEGIETEDIEAEVVEIDPEPAAYHFEGPARVDEPAVAADSEPVGAASEYAFGAGADSVQYRFEAPALPSDGDEYRLEAPAPVPQTEEYRFEAPEPTEAETGPATGGARTLAERLRARKA